MFRTTLRSLAVLALTAPALAEPLTFDFADPKGVNGITFVMDSQLEPIVGHCGGVSGTVTLDPADPASLSGQVSVDLAKIVLVNPKMTSALKGEDWLNIGDALMATMTFESAVLKSDAAAEEPIVTVTGTMALAGVELPMTVDVSLAHHPDAAKARGGAEAGDLLVLRSMFKISRLGLGIKPDAPAERVGDQIMVMVPVVGYSK